MKISKRVRSRTVVALDEQGRRSVRRTVALVVGAIILVLAVGAAVVFGLSKMNGKTEPPVAKTEQPTIKDVEEPLKSELTFAAMGDMLAHDTIVANAKTAGGYDFKQYFASIKPLYDGSDVVFCNPETPSAGAAFGISGYPAFNAPTEFARDLSVSGCNLINLATNHMADKGQAALTATLDEWEKLSPLAIAGANRSLEEQQKVRYFEKNGIKVAFVAFADFSNARLPAPYSVNLYHDKDLVTRLLGEARQNADVVVVSAHWGTEDSHVVNGAQAATAQSFADLGADVIIGTGPHVIQKVDWLDRADGGRTLVWYSIGNMLSSQLGADQLTGGVAKFKIVKTEGGIDISDLSFASTFMSYEWSASEKAAMNLAARRNVKLQPLAEAGAETEQFRVSVEERKAKVREWLSGSAEVQVTP